MAMRSQAALSRGSGADVAVEAVGSSGLGATEMVSIYSGKMMP